MDDIIETQEEIIPEVDSYHVYVQTDEQGRITAVNSSAFVGEDWGTEIDQGYGDKYHHAQGNYFPQPIYTEDGIHRYKLVDGQAVERTEEEIQADREALPKPEPTPTVEELQAKITALTTSIKSIESNITNLFSLYNKISLFDASSERP